jgi:hypothetical protein
MRLVAHHADFALKAVLCQAGHELAGGLSRSDDHKRLSHARDHQI